MGGRSGGERSPREAPTDTPPDGGDVPRELALGIRLWRRLAPDRRAEEPLGDLVEEYVRYRRAELGPSLARLWFLYQVVASLIALHTTYRNPMIPPNSRRDRGDGIWSTLMTSIGQDLRHSVRTLLKAPGFAFVSVATLAIGIGATSAIFSVINAVLLTPLPYDRANELVVVGGERAEVGSRDLRVSGPEYADYLKNASSLKGLGAAYVIDANITNGERPERMAVALVTSGFMSMLHTAPTLGRDFLPDDAGVDIGYVMILSHAAWQRMYGGDPSAIGATVEVDEDPFTVIGVMPEGFVHPGRASTAPIDAWVPFDPTSALFGSRRYRPLDVYGRLAEGVGLEKSRAEFRAIAAGLREQYPDVYPGAGEWELRVVPLLDRVVGDVRSTLFILFGSVGFVLLVACTNVANLVLTRGSTRRRELAIRSALGGGRARIARQLLIESLVLALVGGIVGLLLAGVGTDALRGVAAADFPRIGETTIDGNVLLFTVAAAVAATLLFGVVPAWELSKPDVRRALAEGDRGSSGGRSRMRDGLVIAQIAVSLVLVISAGLMIKSFARLLSVDPGFDADRVLAMQVWLPRPNVPENGRFFRQDQRVSMFERALDRMEATPGVERAAIVSHLPLRATGSAPFELEGSDAGARDEPPAAEVRVVSSGYFDVMSMPLVKGRAFATTDDTTAARVVVINEALADVYSSDSDPLGRRLRVGGGGPTREVVGVVSNVRQHALDTAPRPTIYMPYRQGVGRAMTFVLRTSGAPEAMARPATAALQEVDADLPVYAVASMREVVAETVAQRRMLMLLLSLFAVQAMVLAAIGVYGVIAYATRQRTREIGVRIALGADAAAVVSMILRKGFVLGVVGVGIGLGGAAALTRVLQSFLFQVGRLDPTVFGATALLWIALAAFAAVVPARRGTRVHPVEVLRGE